MLSITCLIDYGIGVGVCVCDCVIDLPTYNLDWGGGGVRLAEAFVVCDPVGVGDDGICFI